MSLKISSNFDLGWCILCLIGVAYFTDMVVTDMKAIDTKERCEHLKGETREISNNVYICVDKEGRVL